MKILFVFLFLLFVAFAAIQQRDICQADNEHDLINGCETNKTNNLLMSHTVEAVGKFLQIQTRNMYFPENGFIKQITCIEIFDMMVNNTGGCPFILSGGADFDDVMIQMISQRGFGLNFTIQIYGERLNYTYFG